MAKSSPSEISVGGSTDASPAVTRSSARSAVAAVRATPMKNSLFAVIVPAVDATGTTLPQCARPLPGARGSQLHAVERPDADCDQSRVETEHDQEIGAVRQRRQPENR